MLTAYMIVATLSVFFFAVALTQGQMDEDPDCRPPHPPGKEAQCCPLPDFVGVVDNFHDVMHKCSDEAGLRKPSGPPGSGTPPTAEEMAAHMSAHECADECLFKNTKYLQSNGELDKDAIKASVTKIFTGDWAALASSAADKCLASAKSEVGASAKCKSGARQMVKCFTRAMFLNCPASSWTESTECAAAKARITKCPNAMVPMIPPKH
uniref:Odorant-binding protein 31 n=1 Tax=Lygus lineolaris TaxID=50650 RepID=W0HI17_LYGLI|nr:odorant-binding protein 31 [Lygus lineolaris]